MKKQDSAVAPRRDSTARDTTAKKARPRPDTTRKVTPLQVDSVLPPDSITLPGTPNPKPETPRVELQVGELLPGFKPDTLNIQPVSFSTMNLPE